MTTNLPKLKLQTTSIPSDTLTPLKLPVNDSNTNPFRVSGQQNKPSFDSIGIPQKFSFESHSMLPEMSPAPSSFDIFQLETPPRQKSDQNLERLDTLSGAWWFNDGNCEDEVWPNQDTYDIFPEDAFVAPNFFSNPLTEKQEPDIKSSKVSYTVNKLNIDNGAEKLLNASKINSDQKSSNESFYSKRSKKSSGCSCKRTRCLRLHCKCFRTTGYCSPSCGCVGCFNTPEYESERQFVMDKMRQIFVKAFEPKVTAVGGALLNSQGCRCKTGCRKNYCDCFRNGSGCSPICKCLNCRNDQVALDPNEVRALYEPALRSKNKIVIQGLDSITNREKNSNGVFEDLDSQKTVDADNKGEGRTLTVAYQTYKRPKLQTLHGNVLYDKTKKRFN